MEIGLGVPRDPVRIIKVDGKSELYQPATDKNLTLKMERFSNSFLKNIDEVDGFIFKNKSPTCGIKNVKRYHGIGNSGSVRDGIGLFAGILKDHFYFIPMEDEGRLRNLKIRENFLTKIFTLSEFREIKNSGKFNDLVDFIQKISYFYFHIMNII